MRTQLRLEELERRESPSATVSRLWIGPKDGVPPQYMLLIDSYPQHAPERAVFLPAGAKWDLVRISV